MVRGRSSNLLNTIREIGAEEVEGVVENCGIRHSALFTLRQLGRFRPNFAS